MLDVNKLDEYKSKKVLSIGIAKKLIADFEYKGKKVGLCHGGFDLLHAGHVKHFEEAKNLCDVLLVSITSDRFVASRKGIGRPIFNEKIRAYMIASIEFVDYVVVSDFNTCLEAIKLLKPSYYIKGVDYSNKNDPEIGAERGAISSVGGEIKYTKCPKMSTTEIIKYIKNKIK